jgi:hypothetical protein
MKRRTFVRGAIGVGTVAALAGCSGDSSPPPRESEVVENIGIDSGAFRAKLEPNPVIQTRRVGEEESISFDSVASVAGSLSPIGVVAAKGKARGAGARAASARGRHGRPKWAGGAYGVWWDNHEDEVEEEACEIAECAIARIAPESAEEQQLPGAGPVAWDKRWTNVEAGQTVSWDEFAEDGWYRFGVRVVDSEDGTDYGWESVDLEVENGRIDEKWKVSPRL